MKGAITGFIVCLIMVFSVYIMQATTATSVRQDELTTNTSNAKYESNWNNKTNAKRTIRQNVRKYKSKNKKVKKNKS